MDIYYGKRTKSAGRRAFYTFPFATKAEVIDGYIREVRKLTRHRLDSYTHMIVWERDGRLWDEPVKDGKKLIAVIRK